MFLLLLLFRGAMVETRGGGVKCPVPVLRPSALRPAPRRCLIGTGRGPALRLSQRAAYHSFVPVATARQD